MIHGHHLKKASLPLDGLGFAPYLFGEKYWKRGVVLLLGGFRPNYSFSHNGDRKLGLLMEDARTITCSRDKSWVVEFSPTTYNLPHEQVVVLALLFANREIHLGLANFLDPIWFRFCASLPANYMQLPLFSSWTPQGSLIILV